MRRGWGRFHRGLLLHGQGQLFLDGDRRLGLLGLFLYRLRRGSGRHRLRLGLAVQDILQKAGKTPVLPARGFAVPQEERGLPGRRGALPLGRLAKWGGSGRRRCLGLSRWRGGLHAQLLLALQHRGVGVDRRPLQLHDFGLVPGVEGGLYPVVHRVENGALVDKAHLQLGGVDVHIHRPKGEVQVQHAGGELPHHDGALVGLLQGGHGGAAADVPAVDEEVLHGAVGPAGGGRADKALHLYMAQLVVDGNEGGGELPAVDGVNGGGELAVPRGVELFLAVPEEPEGNLRVGQGQLIQNARHGVALGGVLFEELHAGGGVVEQIPHQEWWCPRGSRRPPRWAPRRRRRCSAPQPPRRGCG